MPYFKDELSTLGTKTRFSPVFSATGMTFTGSGATYPSYNSWYVKVGNMCTFSIKINMSTVTNFGTGQYKVELPFLPNNNETIGNHFPAWAWVDPTLPPDDLNGHIVLVADHLPTTTVLDLHWLKATTAEPKPVVETIFSQGNPVTLIVGSKIYINGTYITEA